VAKYNEDLEKVAERRSAKIGEEQHRLRVLQGRRFEDNRAIITLENMWSRPKSTALLRVGTQNKRM